MPISKTDFVRALQCEKMLWLDSHVPEQKIVPPEIQAKLDAGNEFGDKAMGIFGPFIETTTRFFLFFHKTSEKKRKICSKSKHPLFAKPRFLGMAISAQPISCVSKTAAMPSTKSKTPMNQDKNLSPTSAFKDSSYAKAASK